MEREAGRPLHELGLRFVRPDRSFLRLLYRAGLHDHHGPDDRTVRRVIAALGVQRACDLIAEALVAAFPAQERSGAASVRGDDGPAGWDWLRLLKVWSECGGQPDVFWRQTPRTLQAWFDGRAAAAELEFRHRAWLAWHTAGLPHSKLMTRGDFEGFLKRIGLGAKGKPKRQTPEQMLAVAKAWTAKLGGSIH